MCEQKDKDIPENCTTDTWNANAKLQLQKSWKHTHTTDDEKKVIELKKRKNEQTNERMNKPKKEIKKVKMKLGMEGDSLNAFQRIYMEISYTHK